MIAVVAGDAALVDFEPDARVRGYPGAEVRDADGDVIDAGKNGRASSRRVGAEDSTSGAAGLPESMAIHFFGRGARRITSRPG
jgi:hypothetical protein